MNGDIRMALSTKKEETRGQQTHTQLHDTIPISLSRHQDNAPCSPHYTIPYFSSTRTSILPSCHSSILLSFYILYCTEIECACVDATIAHAHTWCVCVGTPLPCARRLFQKIPMGTDCTPLVANLFLYYEYQQVRGQIKTFN